MNKLSTLYFFINFYNSLYKELKNKTKNAILYVKIYLIQSYKSENYIYYLNKNK